MAELDADGIEAIESLHGLGDDELHFRFIGRAKHRSFIVNVQFGAECEATRERLRPVEYDFMLAKIVTLLLERIAQNPNPDLH
jgi:hypothetical protein